MIRALLMFPLAAAAMFAALPDSKMTAEDRAKVIQYLDQSEQQFRDLIADVNAEQWKWHPAPGKWSVGEVAEHIVLAEGLLFASVQKAIASPSNPDWAEQTKGKTAFLEQVMIGRAGKATAPESIVPSGTWTKEETIARFNEARARTRKFTETTDVALMEHTLEHPFPVFKTLNAYQWLIYIPLHHIRHNGQLGDVKKADGYPK
jgi:uncharacterized damage-inducible protein DinB